MIHDLDLTLAELIKRELPDSLAAQVAISFATPDEQFPPTTVKLPALNLFLYDVRENLERRTNERSRSRTDSNTVVQIPPPVRVDCSYLITAWPSASSSDPARDEHRLLGAAMRAVLRYRRLPDDVLRGELKSQDPPVRALALQPSQLQSLGEFWQALGGRPKAALNYAVTITVDLFEPVEAPMVTERIVRLDQVTPSEEP